MTVRRRDRMRPFEFVGLALVVGIFTGLTVLISTRDVPLAFIWLGVAFIVMLVTSATIVLMVRPTSSDVESAESAQATSPVEKESKKRTKD